MKQKGFVNVVIIVLAAIILGGVGYFTFIKIPETTDEQKTQSLTDSPVPVNTQTLTTTNKTFSETEIIKNLKTNWQSFQASIPFRPGHPGTTAWSGPYKVQFIGNDNLLVGFEDGYVASMVLLNFGSGQFKILEVFNNRGPFTISEWQNLVNEYGDPSYPVGSYTTDEIVSSPDLTKVTENVFAKTIINIPFIDIGGTTGLDYKEQIGCGDRVVYVPKEIGGTTQPLNATYKELFATGPIKYFGGKELANPIADQAKERIITYANKPADIFKPLRFVKAEIQVDEALVYLEGDLLSNECNDSRVQAQIIFTATQFSNINKVKTYLNGKEFDWSIWASQQ